MQLIKKMLELMQEKKQIIWYLYWGVVTTVVNLMTFYFLRNFIPVLEENIANILSIIAAVIVAYFTNRKFVFLEHQESMLKEFLMFCSGRAFTMIVEELGFFVFATVLHQNEMMVKLCMTIIVIVLNFFISKFFVFKKSKQKAES